MERVIAFPVLHPSIESIMAATEAAAGFNVDGVFFPNAEPNTVNRVTKETPLQEGVLIASTAFKIALGELLEGDVVDGWGTIVLADGRRVEIFAMTRALYYPDPAKLGVA